MSDQVELPPEVFAIFREEAREHLSVIATILGTIESQPSRGGTASLVQDLARRLHSLKGSAAGLGLEPMSRVAHGAESLLTGLKGGTPSPATIAGLFRAMAWLQEALTQEKPDASALVTALEALASERSPAPGEGSYTEPTPASRTQLGVTNPGVGGSQPGVRAGPEHPSLLTDPRLVLQGSDDFVRVRTQALDKLLAPLATLASERASLRRRGERLKELHELALRLSRRADAERFTASEASELRGLADKLAAESALHRHASHRAALAVSSLEHEVQRLRLVSISSLADSLRLAVRDAARRTGKAAEFAVEGATVAVDRRTLEELRSPLMHLVRNAVDHGLEAQPVRKAAGKARVGRVALRCGSDGTMVSLTLEDDGAGIDLEKLRAMALQRGLLADPEASLSPEDVWRLISTPGFSTRAAVSEVSGRGVGLDVVDAAVRKLGGSVTVSSERGVGARFTLRLPASVLTTRVLFVRAGEQTFALPLSGVEGTRWLPSSARYQTGGRRLIDVGTRAARLHRLGGVEPTEVGERLSVVLVQTPSALTAVWVDEILGEEEVAVRPLGPPVRRLRGVIGSTVVESGRVVVVLDPREAPELGRGRGPAAESRASAPAVTTRVLVVDDSITTRTLERHILERNGFSVRLANDGVEALAALRADPVDIVVSDVEMPNLDGLGLARAMRADPSLERIPLILVTSLATEDDRRRGLAAGAQAYLVKARFDQDGLLASIRELLAGQRGEHG